MKKTRVPISACPSCKFEMDGASDLLGEHSPSPGDTAICTNCAGVNAFTDDLRLREATLVELMNLVSDQDFLRTRAAVLSLLGSRA